MTSANPRPFFIAFEGLDGSGKSTCARRVAERTGAQYLTTPSLTVRRFSEGLVRGFDGNQEAAQLFYLATVFDASARVQALLHAGRSVVLDRYFLSTQAYAAFRGSTLRLDNLQEQLQAPDLTIFLQVPLATRRERLGHRGMSAADRETMSQAADERLTAEHEGRRHLGVVGEWARIDAGCLSPDQLVEEVLEALANTRSAGDGSTTPSADNRASAATAAP